MALVPQPHILTAGDAASIVALGYQVTGLPVAALPQFMQQHYPNFNLLALLQSVEAVMVPTSRLPVVKTIEIKGNDFEIWVGNGSQAVVDEMYFVRNFSNRTGIIEVSHDYLIFPVAAQNLQNAKAVFQASLQQYINMGLQKIHVYAGLQGGAYVWARHGFVAANQHDVDRILRFASGVLAPHETAALQAIYKWYYKANPNGKAFPMKLWADLPFMKKVLMNNGLSWEGTLDLTNKEQNANFTMYVFRP